MIQRELCVLVYLGHAAARSHQPGPEVSGPAVPRGLWAAGVCVCFPGLLRNWRDPEPVGEEESYPQRCGCKEMEPHEGRTRP